MLFGKKKNTIKTDNEELTVSVETENTMPDSEKTVVDEKKDAKRPKKVKGKGKAKKGTTGVMKTLVIVFTVFLVLTSLLMYYKTPILVFFKLIDDPTVASTQALNRKKEKLTLKETLFEDFGKEVVFGSSNTINILLFGLDESEDREDTYTIFRPDTIMIASINIDTKAISLVSIPRDSYVTIYGHIYSGSGKDKINSCFAYGSYGHEPEEYFAYGVQCLTETVSRLCGININYYVGIDMDGAEKIIDAIGGVTVDVPATVYDEMTWIPIVTEGPAQTLNGFQFMTLARHRQYSDGDIGRVRVQQMLLKTLFAEVKNTGNLMKLPKLVSLAFDMIRTNITFDEATSLAFLLMENFSADNLSTGTFPGNFGNLYGLSYWIINQSQRVDFCREMWGVSVSYLSQDSTYLTDEPEEPAQPESNDTPDTEPVPSGGE